MDQPLQIGREMYSVERLLVVILGSICSMTRRILQMKDSNRPCPDCGSTEAASFDWKIFKNDPGRNPARHTRCRECDRKRKRNRNKANLRDKNLQQNYGITDFEYQLLLKGQGGVCGICGLPPTDRLLVVDHRHEPFKVRGLIHQGCNVLLAGIDDPVFLKQALAYPEKNK